VGSNLVSSKVRDGNGVKTMPGSVKVEDRSHPILVHSIKRKIQAAKWGNTKKKFIEV